MKYKVDELKQLLLSDSVSLIKSSELFNYFDSDEFKNDNTPERYVLLSFLLQNKELLKLDNIKILERSSNYSIALTIQAVHVTKSYPYDSSLYIISDNHLQTGRYIEYLKAFKFCGEYFNMDFGSSFRYFKTTSDFFNITHDTLDLFIDAYSNHSRCDHIVLSLLRGANKTPLFEGLSFESKKSLLSELCSDSDLIMPISKALMIMNADINSFIRFIKDFQFIETNPQRLADMFLNQDKTISISEEIDLHP